MGLSIKRPPSNSNPNRPLKNVGCIFINTASPSNTAMPVSNIEVISENKGKGAIELSLYQEIPIIIIERLTPTIAALNMPYRW